MKIEGDYLYTIGEEGKRLGRGQGGDQYRNNLMPWRSVGHSYEYDPANNCELRRPLSLCSPELIRLAAGIDPFLDHYL